MTDKLNASMFPGLYDQLGVDVNHLGCIMLDLEALQVVDAVEGGAEDLYYHPDEQKYPWTRGAPAEGKAHVTLLYGLLEPGPEWRPQIDQVLSGFSLDSIEIEEVSFFSGTIPGEDYSVIVGKVKLTEELLNAHHALQLLPHVDTFPAYTPHVTLAYIKNGTDLIGEQNVSTVEKWIASLSHEFAGKKLPVTGLNYGA